MTQDRPTTTNRPAISQPIADLFVVVGQSIKFIGTVSGQSKVDVLLQADVFVLPTYYPAEGQPWAILEAMAAGLPIISTDQGAITESVVDGVNGFIVEKRNSDQVAAKIVQLCQDSRLRRLMVDLLP